MKLLRNTIVIVALSVYAIIGIHTYSYAENDGLSVSIADTDITIATTPENPQPYQNVTIKISSYATDLNKALVEWRNGSNILLSGYGKTSYSYTAGAPNITTSFDIRITTGDTGDQVTKRISITPSEVELLWEAVGGYTPPFYRGKSFVTSESMIRVIAIPNSNTVKAGASNISYTWKHSGKTDQNNSGYAKNSYTFKNDVLNDTETVSVVASSLNNTYNAGNTIDIPIVSPRILFYEKSPTEGILFNNALLNGDSISKDTVTLFVAPYYFAVEGNEPNIIYQWKVNGDIITTPNKKTELTLRPTEKGGYATIDIGLENITSFFQKVTSQLKLNF